MSQQTVISLSDGQTIRHRLIQMPADGSCLFHALTYAIHGKIDPVLAFNIRHTIISHVVKHWNNFQMYTCDELGLMYPDAETYFRALQSTRTYGSVSEIMAAGFIYPYTFEVYEKGILRLCFKGDDGGPIKRLCFSGNFLSGHYDFLHPLNDNYAVNGDVGYPMNHLSYGGNFNMKKRGRPIKKKEEDKSLRNHDLNNFKKLQQITEKEILKSARKRQKSTMNCTEKK